MKRSFIVALLLSAFFLLAGGRTFAGGGIPVVQVLDGSLNQLHADSTVTIMDSIFYNASYSSVLVKPYRVLDNVTLRINESSRYYLQSAFTASVRLQVTSTLYDNSTTVVDTTLSINYRPDSIYTSRSTYHFQNAYKVAVKVLSVSTNVGWNVWNALVVEDELQPFPAFTFSCTGNTVQTVSAVALGFGTSNDELPVSWPFVAEADVYDLEWTYVDSTALVAGNYNTGGVLDPSLIFDNSASRVTVTGTSYNIPLFYDGAGSLFFRVRSVQQTLVGGRKESTWSSSFSGGLGRFDFTGHQRNLNWQSTISYAEEGKRKAVVQYFDGSLRGRQTVTKDNTTNTTVVAESIYDYQGNPAIQVMPAPTLKTIIGYSRNFNIGVNGTAYDQTNFDTMIDSSYYCSASADSMRSDSGAAQYYSAKNPLRDSGFHKFIPDAGGFPFTETSYEPDNTGRIRSQSGVGPYHRIAGGHETKYFYGSPDQGELDALFGTDAGDHSHYYKTMVRDANGQYSVSYTDMHGRTVATALAGILPDSVKLDSLKERRTITTTESLADSGSRVVKDLVSESQKGLLVSLAGTHTFSYNLSPQSLQKPDCNNHTVCYDCLYDLEITITDDCNNQHLPNGKAYDTVLHNFSLIDTTCSQGAAGFSFNFSLFLQEGSYQVTKKLSVSRAGMAYYRDSVFVKRNTCTSLSSTIATQQQLQVSSVCEPACQTCQDSLGTWASFQQRYMKNAGISPTDSANYRGAAWWSYEQALANCNLLCNKVTDVDQALGNMLLDLTPPTGQYANKDSASDVYSIFYTAYDASGNASVLPAYTQASGYVDDNGKLDTVYDETTGTMVAPQQLSPAAFSAKFKLSWAQALLPYHPEYCKLQQYEALETSEQWDIRFQATDTYAAALAKGYLNPLNFTGSSYTRFAGVAGQLDPDPIVGLVSGTYVSAIQNSITLYKGDGLITTNAGMGIWALASSMVKCARSANSCFLNQKTIDSAFVNMCVGDQDMAWRYFRQLYLDVKHYEIDNIITNNTCASEVKASVLIADYRTPNFENAAQGASDYSEYVPTTASDTTTMKNQVASAEASNSTNACAAYVSYWYQQLGPCGYTSADSAAVIPMLLTVCEKGSDASHPYGSSSLAPDSTYLYTSFEDVIEQYNAAHSITNMYCNAYGISSPKPYNEQAAYSNQPVYGIPDACVCSRISSLYADYQRVHLAYTSFSNYLLRVYNTTMSDADLATLLAGCSIVGSPGTCTYQTGAIQLPPVFQCNTGDVCISCEQYKTYHDKFLATYPSAAPLPDSLTVDSVQMQKNQFFANYMNNQFGFVETSNEYLQFAATCAARLAQDSVNSLTDTCRKFTVTKFYSINLAALGIQAGADIRQTPDGGYIVGGSTYNRTNSDVNGLVVKLDAKGNALWARSYGGTGTDYFTRIRTTTDGGYVATGYTKSYHQSTGEVFVVKMDAGGNVLWSKGMGYVASPEMFEQGGPDVIQTSDGGYALLQNTFLFKLDNAGNITWNRVLNFPAAAGTVLMNDIVEDGDSLLIGGIVQSAGIKQTSGAAMPVSGTMPFMMKFLRISGVPIWAKAYNVPVIISDAANDITERSLIKTSWGFRMRFNRTGQPLDVSKPGNLVKTSWMVNAMPAQLDDWFSIPTNDGGALTYAYQYEDVLPGFVLQKESTPGVVNWTNLVDANQYNPLIYSVIQASDSGFAAISAAGFFKMNKLGQNHCHDSATAWIDTAMLSSQYAMAVPSIGTYSPTVSTTIAVNGFLTQVASFGDCSTDPCSVQSDYGPMLCARSAPILPSVTLDSISNCSDSSFFAISKGTEIYNAYRDSLMDSFDSSYTTLCMQAYKYESFTVTHQSSEYHYTLYYYDQAGNLIRTVAPAGVDLSKFGWEKAWQDSVETAKANRTLLKPGHYLNTDYRYNSINHILAQKSPDGGKSRFWYDRLGRLALSQNANQYYASASETGRQYSYTLYDAINRITEVGQISNVGSVVMNDSISRNDVPLGTWMTASVAGKQQITQTIYDITYPGFVGIALPPTTQRNLRNRVSYSTYTDGNNPAVYNHGTFYTYDALGYVDTLLQDFGSSSQTTTQNVMNVNNNGFKRIVYQYDLISGKVNSVAYQPGQADQFYHRYTYDAENRIVLAETSADSINWEKDARDQYYKHGPAARTVLGDQLVQGMDYAYTLQGWLKGINSSGLDTAYDMGRDGDTTWIDRYTAKDSYALTLSYFTGDYKTISQTVTPFPGYSAYMGAGYKPLYNGNISSIVVNIGQFGNPLLYGYTYDQLNRITAMDVYYGFNTAGNSWSGLTGISDYKERVAYDQNGNITQYLRNGVSSTNLSMDSLSYFYNKDAQGRLLNNQLNYVRDAVGSSNYPNDIDNQSGNNYTYDSIGQLIKDSYEGITSITWTVYGKIKEIVRTATASNTTTDVKFTYNPAGSRVSKAVTDNSGNVTYTFYVKDGQENTLSIYSSIGTGSVFSSYSLSLLEQNLFGANLIGITARSVNMKAAYTPGAIVPFLRGLKNYALSNHLGNELVTISDRKIGLSVNGTTVINFMPVVLNANDYYPFGMLMPGRTYVANNSMNFRYGFNRKEKDNEVKGVGNQLDYGMRIYDPRIGKFLSVDPLANKYPSLTPYQFASNSPISGIDLDGLEYYYSTDGKFLGRGFDPKNMEVRLGKWSGATKTGKNLITSVDLNGKASKNWVVIHKNYNEFHRMAAVLYSEGSSTWQESAGIYSVLKNRAALEKTPVGDQATTGKGVDGATPKGLAKIDNKYANKDMVDNANKGLIYGILSNEDYSKGAYFWDGKDFDGKNTNHLGYTKRYLPGYKFNTKTDDLWKQGDNAKNGKEKFGTWKYKYESTTTEGNTTFSKLTDEWRDARMPGKKMADQMGNPPQK